MMTLQAVRGNGFVQASTQIAVGVPATYAYQIGGLPPDFYRVRAQHQGAASHQGSSFAEVEVVAGATASLSVKVFTGVNNITGSILYTGNQNFGNFIIAATTHTDFERQPVFFGTASVASPGAYSLTNLFAPNTYYLVTCRDGNNDFDCDGPGLHTTPPRARSAVSRSTWPRFPSRPGREPPGSTSRSSTRAPSTRPSACRAAQAASPWSSRRARVPAALRATSENRRRVIVPAASGGESSPSSASAAGDQSLLRLPGLQLQ